VHRDTQVPSNVNRQSKSNNTLGHGEIAQGVYKQKNSSDWPWPRHTEAKMADRRTMDDNMMWLLGVEGEATNKREQRATTTRGRAVEQPQAQSYFLESSAILRLQLCSCCCH
jgi:hypothetical protein